MNPANFILNSDYPMEKIIYFYEFSDIAPRRVNMEDPTYSKIIDLPQFKEVPLFFGISATQPDFSDSITINADSLTDGDKPVFRVNGFLQDGCKLSIEQLPQNYTNRETKFYMRIYGLSQTGSVESYIPTQQSSGPFLINTDYDYLPLIFSGRFEADISATETKNISATFGYKEAIGGTYAKIRIKYPDTGNLPVIGVWNEAQSIGNTEYGFPTAFELGAVNPVDAPVIIDSENRIVEIDPPNAVRSGSAVRLHIRIWMP